MDINFTEIPAYIYNADGTLSRATYLWSKGSVYDIHGFRMIATGEIVQLRGWSHDSGEVYVNDGGIRSIVPRVTL